jgi:hypothetical protein
MGGGVQRGERPLDLRRVGQPQPTPPPHFGGEALGEVQAG